MVETEPRGAIRDSRWGGKRSGRRNSRRAVFVGLAALLGPVLFGADPGWGYRFFRRHAHSPTIPQAREAGHWSWEAWRPGEELVWWLGTGWSSRFFPPSGAVPFVASALEAWSEIPTADIRWRVGGVIEDGSLSSRFLNTVSVASGVKPLGYARIWWRFDSIVECDVEIDSQTLWKLGEPEGDVTLIHEFGHCLGLDHSEQSPASESQQWIGPDPVMSYGPRSAPTLSIDDTIGASLLRPAPGWRWTTGSLSGSLRIGEEPARFMAVLLLRNQGGRARPTVVAFSDEEGRFLAEGLPPGEYLLWAYTLIEFLAHEDLVKRHAPPEVDDRLSLRPVQVSAGRETEGISFTLREGRRISRALE